MQTRIPYGNYLLKTAQKAPLVHCITNFVTVNDCANIILACGARPVMAHQAGEAEDITEGSQALLLNMGTVSQVESMLLAGKRSNRLGHPVILDPVGVSGSRLRRETFRRLSEEIHPDVIRGNVSEIRYIATGHSDAAGVDVCGAEQITEENAGEIAAMAQALSVKMNCVIAVSGPVDIVAFGERAVLLRGGHPIMARVTGTGCMSAALMGAFLGASPENRFEAAAAAAGMMKVCGTLAYEKTAKAKGGTMTFRLHLIDTASLLTPEKLEEQVREEVLS